MQVLKKPMVIAHRGCCSLFPENTMESIEASLYKCDLVEIDIQLTRDRQVVIFHDRYLSHITDVEAFEKFKDRKRIGHYDHPYESQRNDWWLCDFTMEELKELSVRQVFPDRPQNPHFNYRIPTLQEALKEVLIIKSNRLKENTCGFLIEIKTKFEDKSDPQDKILIAKMVEVLHKLGLDIAERCDKKRLPVVIQSFSHSALMALEETDLDLPVVHLFDKVENINQDFLRTNSIRNMKGIGITEQHAIPEIRELCTKNNLEMFYWTLRDDQPDHIPFGLTTYRDVYLQLIKLGINGLITEFPDKCVEYIMEGCKV